MKSLTELYKIGKGPSSSHTMGPERASKLFKKEFSEADEYRCTLYGSLAKTGKGHMTDVIIVKTFEPKKITVDFDMESTGFKHQNTMDLRAYKAGEEIGFWRVYSVGGGAIKIDGRDEAEVPDIYRLNSFKAIKRYCTENDIRIWEYVERVESERIWPYLEEIWYTMKRSINEGLNASGVLEGGIGLQRKAKLLYNQRHMDESQLTRENRLVCSYAFAVSEQNASLGDIVTAPTCGSCGVLPAVLKYMQDRNDFSDKEVIRALATGGIIGNLIKTNASISGAECGCQAEIGSACSMAAAALAELFYMDLDQIEYAAEVAMEHHLGLTCDPIGGLVQIPCIERNAVAAMRAINAVSLANFLTKSRKISFDMVVDTMYKTGRDMSRRYRETAEGGLAEEYSKKLSRKRIYKNTSVMRRKNGQNPAKAGSIKKGGR